MGWEYKAANDKPTQKQIEYAQAIAERLGEDLTRVEFTKYEYSRFIQNHKDRYYVTCISDEDFSESGGLGIGNEHFML